MALKPRLVSLQTSQNENCLTAMFDFRMLRSDVFNPALRIKNAPEEDADAKDREEQMDTDFHKKKLISPAEYRRKKL